MMKIPVHLLLAVLAPALLAGLLKAQENPTAAQKPELAILRKSDPHFPIAGNPVFNGGEKGPHEKGPGKNHQRRSDQPKGKKSRELEKRKQPAPEKKKPQENTPKKSPGDSECEQCPKTSPGSAGKSECPKCKNGEKPPVAKNQDRGRLPLEDIHAERREMMRKRFEEMRRHFDENRGKPFGRNHPRYRGPQERSQQSPPSREGREGSFQVADLKHDLEKANRELERARDSLSMAHKELGDKSLMIKKLEDQLKNSRSQLERAEQAVKNAHKMADEHKRMTNQLNELRRHNENLQNDVNVVKRKAAEAVARVQADAKRHIDAMAKKAGEADRMKREIAPSESRKPNSSNARKAPTGSRTTPGKPEPNKPSEPESKPRKAEIAPILFDVKSAVNYEGRDRVLVEAKGILEKAPDATLKITGHSDDTDFDQVNHDISENRAKFLAAFLRVNGIAADKIQHEGIGNQSPPKNGGHNRRVVIEVIR